MPSEIMVTIVMRQILVPYTVIFSTTVYGVKSNIWISHPCRHHIPSSPKRLVEKPQCNLCLSPTTASSSAAMYSCSVAWSTNSHSLGGLLFSPHLQDQLTFHHIFATPTETPLTMTAMMTSSRMSLYLRNLGSMSCGSTWSLQGYHTLAA